MYIVLWVLLVVAVILSFIFRYDWQVINTIWQIVSAIAIVLTILYVYKQAKATEVLARDSILPKVQVFLCGEDKKPRAYIVNSSAISGYIDFETKVTINGVSYDKEVKGENGYNPSNLLGWPHRSRSIFPGIVSTALQPQFEALFKDIGLYSENNKIVITLVVKVTPLNEKDSGVCLGYKKEYVYKDYNGKWQWVNNNWGMSEDHIVRRLNM